MTTRNHIAIKISKIGIVYNSFGILPVSVGALLEYQRLWFLFSVMPPPSEVHWIALDIVMRSVLMLLQIYLFGVVLAMIGRWILARQPSWNLVDQTPATRRLRLISAFLLILAGTFSLNTIVGGGFLITAGIFTLWQPQGSSTFENTVRRLAKIGRPYNALAIIFAGFGILSFLFVGSFWIIPGIILYSYGFTMSSYFVATIFLFLSHYFMMSPQIRDIAPALFITVGLISLGIYIFPSLISLLRIGSSILPASVYLERVVQMFVGGLIASIGSLLMIYAGVRQFRFNSKRRFRSSLRLSRV
ncbi:MAG: hypothetical protein ACFFCO_07340 [Promethearchaeota archaeon]